MMKISKKKQLERFNKNWISLRLIRIVNRQNEASQNLRYNKNIVLQDRELQHTQSL